MAAAPAPAVVFSTAPDNPFTEDASFGAPAVAAPPAVIPDVPAYSAAEDPHPARAEPPAPGHPDDDEVSEDVDGCAAGVSTAEAPASAAADAAWGAAPERDDAPEASPAAADAWGSFGAASAAPAAEPAPDEAASEDGGAGTQSEVESNIVAQEFDFGDAEDVRPAAVRMGRARGGSVRHLPCFAALL